MLYKLGKDYVEHKMPARDNIRGGDRVEIPALFSLGIKNVNNLKDALDCVIDMGIGYGAYEERSYLTDDVKVPFMGAVPTAFSVIALCRGKQIVGGQEYIDEAIKGADCLYSGERKGKFKKSLINRTDAINTNLLCAVALNEACKILPNCSERKIIYRGAIERAIQHAISLQTFSGAFPYSGNGFGVSFIYHSMSLSLLIHLLLCREHGNKIIETAIYKGYKYLRTYVDKEGNINWGNEQLSENHKLGCPWGYAWTHYPLSILGKEDICYKKIHKHPDFGVKKDLFYTAWCMLPLWMEKEDKKLELRNSFLGRYKYGCLFLLSIPGRMRKYYRYIRRKSWRIDKGPIEHW